VIVKFVENVARQFIRKRKIILPNLVLLKVLDRSKTDQIVELLPGTERNNILLVI
jgi:hypothetical protein